MFERKLVSVLIRRLSEPRKFIQIVTGARQTGKTTALTQALSKLPGHKHYISADDPGIYSREWLKNEWQLARYKAQTESVILAIDEIQKVKDWQSTVKLLWDEDSRQNRDLKVVMTGSSSLLLQKGASESLMGRFEILYSSHWSYGECKEAFGFTLDDFLFFGGYPGAASLINDEERWARYIGLSIVEPTISQDILMMEEVRKPALLRSLFLLGSSYSSMEVSYTKLMGQLQDAGNTVTLAHYLELLNRAQILSGLQKFAGNKISVRKSSPRLIPYNTAFMTYSVGATRRRFLNNPSDRGHLIESAVGAYLLSRSQEEGFDVFWWRDRDKEVDFVLQKGKSVTAIEVKSGRIKNVGGSLEFMKLYPDAFSMVVGGPRFTLEEFLLGKVPLFIV
ncbi:MAG: ATP-binding protein [Sphaerochaetaceae bacterium]